MTTELVRAATVEALKKIHNELITRDELLRHVTDNIDAHITKAEFLRTLKGLSIVKKNPIVYNRDTLIDELSNEQSDKTRKAPAIFFHDHEVPVTTSVIDATLDPSITKFFPTKSYRHLLKRMNPLFPLNVFVYGETGVGKSTAAIHIAKSQGRPVVRVNLSKFSDVDDLFGGMRIIDGTTFFDKGPALIAMEMGAVLILDEVDSAEPQLLTDLHPILEHRGVLVKKLKMMVYPAPGFCVIATANTKGRGDLTGRYIGTSVLSRAFLDRFAVGIHYDSPTRGELVKIIEVSVPKAPEKLVNGIADWYELIDQAVSKNAVDEHISPRKILDIIELMMSDGVTSVTHKDAKASILEATSLMDKHVSVALGELWDAM